MRAVTHRIRDGGPTSVALMDRLGPAAFESTADRLVATWTHRAELRRARMAARAHCGECARGPQ